MSENASMHKLAVGVDIGGTHIRAGLVNHRGEVIGKSFTIPTQGNENPEAIVERICETISFALKNHPLFPGSILGIGMGVTGPLDIRNGLILECPQLPTLHYYPLKAKIMEVFHQPVWMDNDANSMILGESLWGAGKGYAVVLGFTLGTGLGCAMVWNGKIHIGKRELSGEIWPSPYKNGTIEDYVSGAGISALYKKITGQSRSAFDIGKLGNEGEKKALKVWDEFGEALGFALSWTINLLDPDVVVLGGSISNSFHLFSQSALNVLQKFGCPSPFSLPPLVKASLGDDAGLIGSAGLVFTGTDPD